ncbi:DNA nucleotidylexotransferase-like [Diadema antillarum]|uniref:DNA nucleotidylexotransferase-like n=1 Tax=Diadema antillarum TaxID=105358 RepID=UPI003A84F876
MAAPWRKRRKFSHHEDKEKHEVKFPEVVIFIINARIQRVRLEHLRRLARKKGFVIALELGENVTHVVTELDTKDHVISIMQRIVRNQRNFSFDVLAFAKKVHILSLKWFTACMEEERPVDIIDKYTLPDRIVIDPNADEAGGPDGKWVKRRNRRFACQRSTPLNHPNKIFTDALEVLEKAAEFQMTESSYSRGLAFRKASAALKALPEEVKTQRDLENLYDIRANSHCMQVILDILDHGHSAEVDGILQSEWFQTMSLFIGVFGCGNVTAGRWCQMGLKTLADVKRSYMLNLTKSQIKGIEYYDELNAPVTRDEADRIHAIVSDIVTAIRPGSTVDITGGFKRGKSTGHDLDLLISHPEERQEEGILPALIQALNKRDLLEYTDIHRNSFASHHIQQGSDAKKNVLDHFERCFSIFRLPVEVQAGGEAESSSTDATMATSSDADAAAATAAVPDSNGMEGSPGAVASGGSPGVHECTAAVRKVDNGRNWVAKRVDFVIAPVSQYPFALFGWTGSRMFNRSIRDYANKVMNMNLSNHGLFDKTNNCALSATSVEDIFKLLKLDYLKPEERNC